MIGELIKKDCKSGQILIKYSYKNNKYKYWTHLDNTLEIAPYLSHYKHMKNITDNYLDEEEFNDNKKDIIQWNNTDVINWFKKKQKHIVLMVMIWYKLIN